MGRVVAKQGFLGLGRPVERWHCDKCGVECQNQFWKEKHVFCRSCANSIDPEIVHGWSSEEIVREYKSGEFFRDTADGKERLIEQCHTCLGLLLAVRSASQIQRLYYRVGFPRPSAESYPCIPHSGYDEHGNVKIESACDHDFIVVGTSKRLDREAHSKYEHMRSHRNRMVESMYGTDEVDIQYHCFGRTHFWCHKCGLYHSPNPQRERLLPKRGRIGAKHCGRGGRLQAGCARPQSPLTFTLGVTTLLVVRYGGVKRDVVLKSHPNEWRLPCVAEP